MDTQGLQPEALLAPGDAVGIHAEGVPAFGTLPAFGTDGAHSHIAYGLGHSTMAMEGLAWARLLRVRTVIWKDIKLLGLHSGYL